MSVLETATTVQDQVLDVIKAGQDAILSAVDTLADTVTPITEKLPTPPFADKIVNPIELVNNYFSFASKLMSSQQEFTLKLLDSYTPAKTAKPAAKSTAKVA